MNFIIKIFNTAFVLVLLLICFNCQPADAKVRLASIFQDHMVMQRDEPVNIYGYGDPKEVVGVKFAGQKAVAITDSDGKWSVKLKAVKAGGPPLELVVLGDEKIVVRDIIMGEVWLCGGQSNMYLDVKSCKYTDRFKDPQFDGNIRFVTLDQELATIPLRKKNVEWKIMDKTNFDKCSSVAFQFARRVYEETNLPIGLVIAAAPGSKVQSWISRKTLKNYPFGRVGLKRLDSLRPKGTYTFTTPTRLLSRKEVFKASKDENLKEQLLIQRLFFCPAVAYNSFIDPLVPFQFKGIIWYQGESNVDEPGDYSKYLSTLIKDWREQWSKPHMPFIYVQLPPYGPKLVKPTKNICNMALFRSAQAECKLVPYTYMAVTLDCCPVLIPDWHSSDKLKIGDRIANIALATQYNKPYAYKSPSFFTYDLKDSSVIVHFRNAKDLKSDGAEAKGFVIIGDNRKPFWANAEIDGQSVKVWSKNVRYPKKVTYAWADNPNGNLKGEGNLPVAPFSIEIDEAQN